MLNGYRTIITAIIAMSPAIAGLLGFELAPGFNENVNGYVDSIITVVSGGLAIYFRMKAEVPGLLVKKSS